MKTTSARGMEFTITGAARLPLPSWAQGLIFRILLSLPDAIITKAYAPILILGAVVPSVE